MDADAELDTLVRRDTRVAFDHGDLDFDRAAHCVDDAAKLGDESVAGPLDDATIVYGNCRIDQVAAQRTQSCQSSIFVRAREPAVADNVGDQDCSELARFPHGAPSGRHSE